MAGSGAQPPVTGQITTSGTATPLSSQPITPNKWVLKAPASNTGPIYFGAAGVTTGTGFQMDPGDSLEFSRLVTPFAVYDLTPADIYVVGSGGIATWLAFR